jgi:hypothetical protein
MFGHAAKSGSCFDEFLVDISYAQLLAVSGINRKHSVISGASDSTVT